MSTSTLEGAAGGEDAVELAALEVAEAMELMLSAMAMIERRSRAMLADGT